ncbi:MAG: family protein phosphatase [Actinomycetota bacterium]|jgi:protein phosphatase|nr:family protein phosphatase [Actinomycetota bacterium]
MLEAGSPQAPKEELMFSTDQFPSHPVRPPLPRWHTASAQGPRSVNADAAAAFARAKQDIVFALADGVGDEAGAARAARVAVSAASRAPAAEGPVAAVLAAQRAVRELGGGGDCVLVVAIPFGDGLGFRVAWLGDARAYSWTAGSLVQLTTDHTLAQYFRDHDQQPSPHMEHIVTASVRTAGANEIGTAEVHSGGLLLTSDGVHKTLTAEAMLEALTEPEHAAASLVETAIAGGGSDNATAIVVAPPGAVAKLSTVKLTAAA